MDGVVLERLASPVVRRSRSVPIAGLGSQRAAGLLEVCKDKPSHSDFLVLMLKRNVYRSLQSRIDK